MFSGHIADDHRDGCVVGDSSQEREGLIVADHRDARNGDYLCGKGVEVGWESYAAST